MGTGIAASVCRWSGRLHAQLAYAWSELNRAGSALAQGGHHLVVQNE